MANTDTNMNANTDTNTDRNTDTNTKCTWLRFSTGEHIMVIRWSERVGFSVGSTDCGQGGGKELEQCVWRAVQCLHNGRHAGTIAL